MANEQGGKDTRLRPDKVSIRCRGKFVNRMGRIGRHRQRRWPHRRWGVRIVAGQAGFAWLSPLTGMTVGTPAVDSAQENAPALGASTDKRLLAFQGPAQFTVAGRCCS